MENWLAQHRCGDQLTIEEPLELGEGWERKVLDTNQSGAKYLQGFPLLL